MTDVGAGIPPVVFQIVGYALDGLRGELGIGIVPVRVDLGVAGLACICV